MEFIRKTTIPLTLGLASAVCFQVGMLSERTVESGYDGMPRVAWDEDGGTSFLLLSTILAGMSCVCIRDEQRIESNKALIGMTILCGILAGLNYMLFNLHSRNSI